jgi:DnaK suppressor protein
MAATRAKTSGRKKPATKTTVRKKTAGKAAASRKKATREKTPVRKKTLTQKKTAMKKTLHNPAQPPFSLVEQIAPYKVKRGETYMNEDQLAHFCKLLLAWKRDLMEEADRTVHHMQDEASNFPDPNDRASQESEFSLELRTRDRERKLLRKIDKTLKRVETDDYGWCDACGAEIGIRRLEARPTATLCFDCKTLDEIRERQKGL